MFMQKTKLHWGDRIGDKVNDVIMYNSLKHFGNDAEQRYWSIVRLSMSAYLLSKT